MNAYKCFGCGNIKQSISSNERIICNDCGYEAVDVNKIEEIRKRNSPPLLTIELQDESSVPKVIYKGREIKWKQNVFFDWDTSDERSPGGLSYAIEHQETGNGQVTCNRIERRVRDHAT